jgi:hypothetical protein
LVRVSSGQFVVWGRKSGGPSLRLKQRHLTDKHTRQQQPQEKELRNLLKERKRTIHQKDYDKDIMG